MIIDTPNIMNKKANVYVISLSIFSQELYTRSRIFTENFNLKSLSFKGANYLTLGLIEDSLYEPLYWTVSTENKLYERLSKSLSWWDEKGYDSTGLTDLGAFFYSHVIDVIETKIQILISEIIGDYDSDDMWYTWDLFLVGDNVFLKRNKDFRVLEYERLVEQRIIELPNKLKKKRR